MFSTALAAGPAALVLCCGVATASAHPAHAPLANPHGGDPEIELVHACWPDEHGNLTGTRIPLRTMPPENRALGDAMDGRRSQGEPERIDLVFVGDGYRQADMAAFHAHVDGIEAGMFAYEPFITYRPYFRVHRVEVVSNESGVSNDPVPGVTRDTALNMAYWCGGTERALCVSVSKALHAAMAGVSTDVDQVVAVANSTKYGGVGYPGNNLGTASGGNSAATQIVIHEIGHSLGDLADEYNYGGPTHYAGGEPGTANVSTYNSTQMNALQRKWFRWLGAVVPGFDGPVGTFEGAHTSETGIYRPSNNSMMRNLGRPFNLPSAEALIKEFYREVGPIDDATPAGTLLSGSDTVYAVPQQPDGHDLDVFWSIDGQPLPQLDGVTHVDLSTLGLDDGVERTIRVTVVDPTQWVRDPVIRENFLTERREWVVNRCVDRADMNQDGRVDSFDLLWFIGAYADQHGPADFDASGTIDIFDLMAYLDAYVNPCPQR